MASNAERAATLVRALEASVVGDSTVVADLDTDDVRGWAPAFTVSSAAELAVELEDRSDRSRTSSSTCRRSTLPTTARVSSGS